MTMLLALMLIQSPSLPNIEGWTEYRSEPIDLRFGPYGTTTYLGMITVYQNPKDENEFVKVIQRHIPVISVKQAIKNDEDMFVIRKYNEADESGVLEELREKSDTFIYFREKVKKDFWTGKNILDGFTESWIMTASGMWHYQRNNKIDRRQISEPNKAGETRPVGFQFQIGNAYQILRLDSPEILGESK